MFFSSSHTIVFHLYFTGSWFVFESTNSDLQLTDYKIAQIEQNDNITSSESPHSHKSLNDLRPVPIQDIFYSNKKGGLFTVLVTWF